MPSLCTVYGTLEALTSGALAQGTIIFELSNLGTGNAVVVSGTSILPQLKYTVYSAADGTFTQKLWGNDNISPANTIYNVTYRDFLGNEIGPIQYSITGSSVNLNSASPINNVLPPLFAAGVSVLTLLNQQGPLTAVTGTGADATLYTYTMPANTVGAGQGLRITTYWNHSTGTASVSYKIKLGSTTLFTLTGADTSAGSSTVVEIFNNASVQNAQNWASTSVLGGSTDVEYTNTGTSSVNLALSSSLKLTFDVANTDAVTPEFWLVEIINGPPNVTPSRLQVAGSALVSGDFTLTGWGSGATITSIRGCDSANEFLITAGTGPSLGPTVQLTFHDGAWPNEPITIAEIIGGTGQSSTNAITGTTTSWTCTYQGFPVAGQTYLYRTVSVGI